MKYKQILVMGTNCYLFWDEFSKNAVCIDPGFAGRKIARVVRLLNLQLKYVFLTHCHADHVSGIDDLCSELEILPIIYLSQKEQMYEEFPFRKKWGDTCRRRFWEEWKTVVLDSMRFEIISTPGHSPGSVCIFIKDYLISGDIVFRDSIGRTDFLGSNPYDMAESLEKILCLPDTINVLPGHDTVTTIAEIKKINPYIKPKTRR